MQQNSFVKLGDGSYARQVSTAAGGAAQSVTIATTGNTIKIDPANSTVKLDQTDPNNRVATIPNPAENSTSVTDTATVAAPGAGVTVCETVALAAGTWDLEAITFIGGTTVAATEQTNMRLRIGTTAISRVLNPVPGTTGAVGTGQLRVRVIAPGGTTANIIAVAAATASSVYSGSIVARRVL
jgi:hypothetical protein